MPSFQNQNELRNCFENSEATLQVGIELLEIIKSKFSSIHWLGYQKDLTPWKGYRLDASVAHLLVVGKVRGSNLGPTSRHN